ncbi:MAG TPA: tetratricopeptide repeat protein [Candidatus Mcinerneyibacteriales bacterium]|nr:tetratricopeptide repeat protein [Candidatus Mcinerneyibacteriales bacterium]
MRRPAFTLLLFLFLTLSLGALDIDTLKKGLSLEPQNLTLKKTLLEAYYTSGYFLDAITLAREMIEKDEDDERTLELLIRAYLARQDFESASFYFLPYDRMKKSPYTEKFYDLLFSLGQGLYEKGEYHSSRFVFEKALSVHPEEASISYYLGQIAVNQGHDEQAVGYYEQAFVDAPEPLKHDVASALVTAYNRLIHFDYYRGEEKSCEVLLEKAREPILFLIGNRGRRVREASEILAFESGYYIQKKEWGKAVDALTRLLEYEPNYPGIEELLQQAAQGLTEADDLNTALEIYGIMMNTMGAPLEVMKNIALYFAGIREWEPAYYYSKKAIEREQNAENVSRFQAIREKYVVSLQEEKKRLTEEGNPEEALLAEYIQAEIAGTVPDPVKSEDALKGENELLRLWNEKSGKKRLKASTVYCRLAEDLFKKGSPGEAYHYLVKGLNLWPHNPEGEDLYIRLYPLYQVKQERLLSNLDKLIASGDYAKASQTLEENTPLLQEEMIQKYREELLSMEEKKEKRTARSLLNTGRMFLDRNNFRRARSYFNRALGYDDYKKEAAYLLRLTSRRENETVQGLKDEYLLHQLNQNVTAMKAAINDILFIRPGDNWARARAVDLGLLEENIKSEKAESLYLEGIRFYTEGHFREAIEAWEQAESLIPGYKNVSDYLERARKRITP